MMETPLYIDTHAHLYDEAFQEDVEAVLSRAKAAGIVQFILPGIDASTQEQLEALCDQHPESCYPCIGLHPTSVGENWKEELTLIEKRLSTRQYYAIGEIGLDGYWSTTYMAEQQEVFFRQLCWAVEQNLPVIIHLREATEALFTVLERFRKEHRSLPKGVFHAFSGSIETYHRIQQYGDFHFGIGGVATYKKAGIADTIPFIPLDRLLLETDAPYLTPVPHRGKRNEPTYIPHIAERIAQLKQLPLETVAATTTQQARLLFQLPD